MNVLGEPYKDNNRCHVTDKGSFRILLVSYMQ